MTKIAVYHLDDDKYQIEYFRSVCKENNKVTWIGGTSNYLDAFEKINTHHIDLLFLDVEMPEICGFEFIKKVNGLGVQIVILSNHDHFAIQAFKSDCMHYIQKPITGQDLNETIIKYLKFKKQVLKTDLPKPDDYSAANGKLMITTMKTIEFITLTDIVFIYSDGPYSHFKILHSNAEIISSKHLKYYEELLESHKNFERVHKSYLINN
jgi:two-component system, LytTR family, response regulator